MNHLSGDLAVQAEQALLQSCVNLVHEACIWVRNPNVVYQYTYLNVAGRLGDLCKPSIKVIVHEVDNYRPHLDYPVSHINLRPTY